MIFDKLCNIVEKHNIQALETYVKQAQIFEIPAKAHEFLPKTGKPSDFSNFFLPFPITAIEDTASCIILIDSTKNQRGLDKKRFFIEALSINTPAQNFGDYNKLDKNNKKLINDLKNENDNIGFYTIIIGILYNMSYINNKDFNINSKITDLWAGYKQNFDTKSKISKLPIEALEQLNKGSMINISTAIQEINWLNKPTNFVLEKTSVKLKKRKKKKLLRSHERSKYTLLEPLKIKKILSGDTSIDIDKETFKKRDIDPHYRRRHVRWLSHEKYSYDKKGEIIKPSIIPYGKRKGQEYYKEIDVPAIWVGPKEAIINGKRYKVRLDL